MLINVCQNPMTILAENIYLLLLRVNESKDKKKGHNIDIICRVPFCLAVWYMVSQNSYYKVWEQPKQSQ